ncbi:NAD(P)H-dependent oxidoreductase [Desulfoscipio gibsoniae]|uniref:Putative NADPH-quinone reductase (Modulator of drug activity B) n=1 Tax=Desulfoscipio gibsoniae DSM 7213 TaxID=767817 RepID=R4KHI0_9FIRM|nr:NAD(P)H-dependent oxidoreductase [Desulfoscipio gibsoniae]AGL02049.1 putative NADPH-quinone reductase (modulator of drug activity B) [Desulfoscipio gibsoniae DSM 7213]
MKALVIFCHPNPKSFNAAILDVVKQELEQRAAEIKVKDLYAMNWNPVLSASDFQQFLANQKPEDIAGEQADVAWADILVLISPIWWFSVPAMLKGYIDRVMSQGFAYEYTDNGPRGLLPGKRAAIITTSGADENTANQSGMMQAINTSFVNGIFAFCGFADVKYINYYAVPMVSNEERKQMLDNVRQFIKTI